MKEHMFILIGIGVLVFGMVVHFFTGSYQVEDIGFGMMSGAFLAYWHESNFAGLRMIHGGKKMERAFTQGQANALYTTLVTVRHALENGDWERNIKDPLVAEDIMKLRKWLAQLIDIMISPLEIRFGEREESTQAGEQSTQEKIKKHLNITSNSQ